MYVYMYSIFTYILKLDFLRLIGFQAMKHTVIKTKLYTYNQINVEMPRFQVLC